MNAMTEMIMTTLVPMGESEYRAYMATAIPAYAADKVASGEWSRAAALDLSRRTFDELLPQGLATPGNHLFVILDPARRIAVGTLWIAEMEQAGKRIAFVYDIGIAPEQRRKGHATRAFLALEEKVAALGLTGIALHVFGHNVGAQALYAKLGYQPTNINMFKTVGRTGA